MAFDLFKCKLNSIAFYPSTIFKVLLRIFKFLPNLTLIVIFVTPLVVDLYTNHLLTSINQSISFWLPVKSESEASVSLDRGWSSGPFACAKKVSSKDVFLVETVKTVPAPCKPKPKKKYKKKKYLPKTIVVTIPEKKKEEECCPDDYDYGYDYYQFGGPFGFGGFGPGFGGPIGFGGPFGGGGAFGGPGIIGPGAIGPGAVAPGFGGAPVVPIG